MIVGFSGHREFTEEDSTEVEINLLQLLVQNNVDEALVGGAVGFDNLIATQLIDYDIPYTLVIPFRIEDFTRFWSTKDYKLFLNVKQHAKEFIILGDSYKQAKQYQVRNMYLVDNSNFMVFWFKVDKGGTYNCLQYCIKVKKPFYNLVDATSFKQLQYNWLDPLYVNKFDLKTRLVI